MASPRRSTAFVAILLLAAASVCAAQEPAIPKPAGFVSDTAGVMGEWAGKTEALCRKIEAQTTSEVAVLTVASTAPLDAQQYALQVFERWKIGKKGKDNGVLILVAVNDRKLWIATGYGVEGVLPDGKVGEIRDRILRPLFRQSRYGEGIYLGVNAVGDVLSGGKGEAPTASAGRSGTIAGAVLFLLLLLLGPILVLWSILAGPFSAHRRRRGGGWFWGGLGGGASGGGFGGGGFGGGGFGGFGGGGFGGGGAGGSW